MRVNVSREEAEEFLRRYKLVEKKLFFAKPVRDAQILQMLLVYYPYYIFQARLLVKYLLKRVKEKIINVAVDGITGIAGAVPRMVNPRQPEIEGVVLPPKISEKRARKIAVEIVEDKKTLFNCESYELGPPLLFYKPVWWAKCLIGQRIVFEVVDGEMVRDLRYCVDLKHITEIMDRQR